MANKRIKQLKVSNATYDIEDASAAHLATDNTFTGTNTFTKYFSVYDEVSGNRSTLDYSALTLEGPIINETCMLNPAGLEHRQMDGDGATILHKTTLAFEKEEGSTTATITVPNKTGTLALTSDVVANPTAPGTTPLARLKVGSTVYNLPSGGASGGVTSVTTSGSGNAVTSASISGNKLTLNKGSTFLTAHQSLASCAKLSTDNTFTGINTFTKLVRFGDVNAPTEASIWAYSAIEFFNSVYSCGRLVTDNENDRNLTYKYNDAVVKFPKKTGTLAITNDIKIKSATLSDSGTTLTLTI